MRDAADPVARGHFRNLARVEAGPAAPLLPGKTPCLQVCLALHATKDHSMIYDCLAPA